jgi:hypothetical protein
MIPSGSAALARGLLVEVASGIQPKSDPNDLECMTRLLSTIAYDGFLPWRAFTA